MHILKDTFIGPDVRHPKGKTSFGGRMVPTVIVIHETASPVTIGHSTRFILSGGGKYKASYHAIFERDGTVQQLVDLDRKAHHAGPSVFNGRSHVNNYSIGLSLASPGFMIAKGDQACLKYGRKTVASFPIEDCVAAKSHTGRSGYWLQYTDEQLSALKKACRLLIEQYPSITDITTHADIDTRGWKTDAGPLFPIDEWRVELFAGKKPADDMLRLGSSGKAVLQAQQLLHDLGYFVGDLDKEYGAATQSAVASFQLQNGLHSDGIIGPRTWAALRSDDAKPFPTATRDAATPKDLLKRGSKTAETGNAMKVTGTAIGAVQVPVGILAMAESAKAWKEPMEAISGLAGFVADNWRTVAMIVLAALLFMLGHYLMRLRLRDFMTFRHRGK